MMTFSGKMLRRSNRSVLNHPLKSGHRLRAAPLLANKHHRLVKRRESQQVSKPVHQKQDHRLLTIARYQASTIEEIRKVVKTVGREVTFARVTPEEKRQLMDIVYSLKRQGVRTSENEIVRIAINFMLNDQRTSGKESVLNRVLAALNA